MSGDGKRGDAEWPEPPRPSSTLPTSQRIRNRIIQQRAVPRLRPAGWTAFQTVSGRRERLIGTGSARALAPFAHVGRRVSVPTNPRNNAASGQLEADASPTRVAVSLIRAAIFSKQSRIVENLPLAGAPGGRRALLRRAGLPKGEVRHAVAPCHPGHEAEPAVQPRHVSRQQQRLIRAQLHRAEA